MLVNILNLFKEKKKLKYRGFFFLEEITRSYVNAYKKI